MPVHLQPRFIIDGLFPAQRIHLVGGNSDAGKTRWLLPTFHRWARGLPFLSHSCHPVLWAYVSTDRLQAEAEDTMWSMGLDPAEIPLIPAFGRDNKGWVQIFQIASQMKYQLLVIEGFSDFVGDGNNKKEIRELLCRMASFLEPCADFPNGLTIIGVMESPKQKPHEAYADPRQRISGASGWVYHSSTVVLISPNDPEGANSSRTLYFCLKNGPRLTYQADFDESGRLVVTHSGPNPLKRRRRDAGREDLPLPVIER